MRTKGDKEEATAQLREAHEAACRAYSALSDLMQQCNEQEGLFNESKVELIEELTEAADNLQANLYDLLNEDENGND